VLCEVETVSSKLGVRMEDTSNGSRIECHVQAGKTLQ
jgi:hypothetical protein